MPQQRISLTQSIFYLGLVIMLLAGIGSTAVFPAGHPAIAAVIMTGAVTALTARIWQNIIRRSALRRDNADFVSHPAG